IQYPLSSFFLRGCVARRSKAAHISRSSPHQVLGNSHEKRLDVDEVLYQHYVKKLLVGYLRWSWHAPLPHLRCKADVSTSHTRGDHAGQRVASMCTTITARW